MFIRVGATCIFLKDSATTVFMNKAYRDKSFFS